MFTLEYRRVACQNSTADLSVALPTCRFLSRHSMQVLKLPRHPGLFATTRLRILNSDPLAAPIAVWMLLIVLGALAAVSSAFMDLGLHRIPGHAILRVVFPVALGLAMVPRRGSGTVMGGSALVTAILLRWGGTQNEGLGFGAVTSLLATGPILDFALRRADGGWKQYLAFAIGGLTSNLLALVARGTAKAVGFEAPGRRPLGEWLAQASITYVVCGLLAGLISGAVLFYARRPADDVRQEQPS